MPIYIAVYFIKKNPSGNPLENNKENFVKNICEKRLRKCGEPIKRRPKMSLNFWTKFKEFRT